MNVLLDSHVFVWQDMDSGRLSTTARKYLNDPKNRILFSVASAWEISIKIQIGKLKLSDTLSVVVAQQRAQNPFEILPVMFDHALQVCTLPLIHKDPFDRMLVVQAINEDATILTDDPFIRQYPVRTAW